MPNPIKFSTGSESLALKKGKFFIGTGDVGKGPTSTTGYFNGITPPSGGYTIYLNKESGGPSIYSPANDAQLIVLTNLIAGQSYTTVNQCLDYFAGQTDKICFNIDYPPIITNGLVFSLDAGFTPSYPKSTSSWYNLSLNANNGTLINSPTFNTSNEGSIVFDGVDDRTDFSTNILTGLSNSGISFDAWVFPIANLGSQQMVVGAWSQSATNDQAALFIIGGGPFIAVADGSAAESGAGFGSLSLNQWQNIVGTWNPNREYKTYINGEIRGTGTQTGNGYNVSGSSLFRVGAQNQGEARFFNGRIAVVRIYNRTLTGGEITQNYNAQKGRFGL